MCEPTTIALAMVAVSTVAQGYQAQQQGKFQQGVSRFNAREQENQATRTRNLGIEEENKQREATAQLVARQRAQIAASGVELGSGSALQLQEDAVTLGEVDALRIRSNFEDQAASLETQAGLTTSEGGFAKAAGDNKFAGSILTAAGGFVGGGGVSSSFFTPKSAAVISPFSAGAT